MNLARDVGVAGDRGDAQLLAGGRERIEGGGDVLALELPVQPLRSDHRLPLGGHAGGAGRGFSDVSRMSAGLADSKKSKGL